MVPSLPGCITWDENVEHALEMAKDAIQEYIAVLQEEDEPTPDDNGTFEYSLQLSTEVLHSKNSIRKSLACIFTSWNILQKN